MHIQVSVSRIEELRKVVETEWATEAMLIRSIKAPTPLGWQARYGEALHACIEDPDAYRGEGEYVFTSREGGRYAWPLEIVDACRAAWPKGCVFERRCSRDYYFGGDKVTVSGRVDALHGIVIVEGKTRFGSVAPLDYADSLQWAFYLDMLPWATCVEYRVHEIGGMYADDNTGELRVAKGGPRLEEIHVFRLWRQANTRARVERWAEEFLAWSKSRGLTGFLGPYGREVA